MLTRSLPTALAIGAWFALLPPALGDVKIILKDGRVITVPIDPEEVQSITMQEGRTGGNGALPPAPTPRSNMPGAPTFRADSPVAPPVEADDEATEKGATPRSGGGHIRVGPTRAIKTISQAAGMAKQGDVIEIDAGTYRGDVASWPAGGITIRGVGGRARLDADGANAEGKAIWVIKGNDVTIENVEFTGAAVPDNNGAGIRAEGNNLKIVNCFFHDNQEGILTSMDATNSVIDIENSEFARDGGSNGSAHEIYINKVRKLIVRGSYFHEGRIGHLIKTRAEENLIEGNRITNENADASYKIDLSNGGRTYIIGNLIEQGPIDENHTMIAYAMEGPTNPDQSLYVINNTFVNDQRDGVFVHSRSPGKALVVNNIFVGGGTVFQGAGDVRNNLFATGPTGTPKLDQGGSGDIRQEANRIVDDAGLTDIAHFDYRPKAGSPAIGAGVDPGRAGDTPLSPSIEYVHPAHAASIKIGPAIDLGAYQHKG